jgi:hypothetical protein
LGRRVARVVSRGVVRGAAANVTAGALSAADVGHGKRTAGQTGEGMVAAFARQGDVEQSGEGHVVVAFAQPRSQRHAAGLVQTTADATVGRQAQPVTVVAKRLGVRGDEAKDNVDVAGWAAPATTPQRRGVMDVAAGQGMRRRKEVRGQGVADVGTAEKGLLYVAAGAARVHLFDKAHFDAVVVGSVEHRAQFVVVVAALHDHVPLHPQAVLLGGVHRGAGPADRGTPAHQVLDAVVAQGVEVDSDRRQARLHQGRQKRRQAQAVGGQGQVGHCCALPSSDDVDDVVAQRGFAAGEADFAHAPGDEERCQASMLGGAKPARPRRRRRKRTWSTVATVELTGLEQRHPQAVRRRALRALGHGQTSDVDDWQAHRYKL